MIWWCASPNTGNGNNVYNTTATGTQNNNNANNSNGLAGDYTSGHKQQASGMNNQAQNNGKQPVTALYTVSGRHLK